MPQHILTDFRSVIGLRHSGLAGWLAVCVWPRDRFVAALLDGRDVDDAAADFRRLADRVITLETGQPAR